MKVCSVFPRLFVSRRSNSGSICKRSQRRYAWGMHRTYSEMQKPAKYCRSPSVPCSVWVSEGQSKAYATAQNLAGGHVGGHNKPICVNPGTTISWSTQEADSARTWARPWREPGARFVDVNSGAPVGPSLLGLCRRRCLSSSRSTRPPAPWPSRGRCSAAPPFTERVPVRQPSQPITRWHGTMRHNNCIGGVGPADCAWRAPGAPGQRPLYELGRRYQPLPRAGRPA